MTQFPRLRLTLCCGGLILAYGCQSAGRQFSHDRPLPPKTSIAVNKVTKAPADSGNAESSAADARKSEESTGSDDDVVLTAFQEVVPPPATLESSGPTTDNLKPIPSEDIPVESPAITLETLEQIAMQHNPAIAQAVASAHKATGFRNQVGRYPNPVIGYSGQQLSDQGTAQQLFSIDQEIVTARKLRLNEGVLDQEVQSQLWEVEAQRYRVLTDIRTRFYQALAAQQRNDLAKEFQAVASEGVRIAEIRKEALEGSVPEVLQAEIQLYEVDLIQQRALIDYQKTWSELIAVAGMPMMGQQRLVGELRVQAPKLDWDTTYQNLVAANPAVHAARSRVSRAVANMNRQEVQAIPNLLTTLQAGHDQGTGSGMMNVQVGIPVPLFNRNTGNISAAQAEYCRATQDVRRLELAVRQSLAVAAKQYESASITVDRLENKILPKAQQTLDLSEKAYSAGEFSFLQVLIVRRTYFDSNLQYNEALSELAQSKVLIDGLLLSGGLDDTRDVEFDDGLRGQTLSGN